VEDPFGNSATSILGPHRTLCRRRLLPLRKEHRHLLRRRKSHKLGPAVRSSGLENNRTRYQIPTPFLVVTGLTRPVGADARFEAGPLTSLAINPSSTVVAVGSQEGLTHLVSLQNGTILATLGAKTGDSIESLAFATTLPLLAAASVDSRIYLYDTQSFRLRNSLSHDDAVTAIVLPTGSVELTSTSIDRTVRRWDIRTGLEIARRTGHQDAIVGGLAISKDGKTVVTGGDDTVALVWGF